MEKMPDEMYVEGHGLIASVEKLIKDAGEQADAYNACLQKGRKTGNDTDGSDAGMDVKYQEPAKHDNKDDFGM